MNILIYPLVAAIAFAVVLFIQNYKLKITVKRFTLALKREYEKPGNGRPLTLEDITVGTQYDVNAVIVSKNKKSLYLILTRPNCEMMSVNTELVLFTKRKKLFYWSRPNKEGEKLKLIPFTQLFREHDVVTVEMDPIKSIPVLVVTMGQVPHSEPSTHRALCDTPSQKSGFTSTAKSIALAA